MDEQDFWLALRKAIEDKNDIVAHELVLAQMQIWQTMLQHELDQLTHNGNNTVH